MTEKNYVVLAYSALTSIQPEKYRLKFNVVLNRGIMDSLKIHVFY